MDTVRSLFVVTSGLTLLAGGARASDPVGVYALVEKVVLEPNDKAPERIQVWGAFSLATPTDRDRYDPPARGYLYFRLPSEKAEKARIEWADLQKLAVKAEPCAFGSRYAQKDGKIRVRRAAEKPADPSAYPLGFGVTKMQNVEKYAPVRDLLLLPAQESPADGGEVRAGKVTLVARNLPREAGRKARYLFEIEGAGGEREESPALEPGDKETRWSPRMEVKEGVKYTWRVRAVEGDWKGPVAIAVFNVPSVKA
jgi:hypothetical protein